MKKTLIIFLTFTLALAIAAPALAQEKLQKCVKVRADVSVDGPGGANRIYQQDIIIAAEETSKDECGYTSVPDTGIQNECAFGADEKVSNSPCWTKDFGIVFVLSFVNNITNWAFIILMSVTVLMFIYAGFLYLTSQGDPTRAGKGKQVLTFAIIGLAIALLAKIIPGVVKFIMGTSTA